jgi:hypothetical protein
VVVTDAIEWRVVWRLGVASGESRRVASGREWRVLVSGEWRVTGLVASRSGQPEWRVVVTDAGEWKVVSSWRLGVASGEPE